MKTKTFVVYWNFGMGDCRYSVRATSKRDAQERLELHMCDPDEERDRGIKELPLNKTQKRQRRADNAAWRKFHKSLKS